MSKDQKQNLHTLLTLSPMLAIAFTLVSSTKFNIPASASGEWIAMIVLTPFFAGVLTLLNHLIYRNYPTSS